MQEISRSAKTLGRENWPSSSKWNPRAPGEIAAARKRVTPETQWGGCIALLSVECSGKTPLDLVNVGSQANPARVYRLTERTSDKHWQHLAAA